MKKYIALLLLITTTALPFEQIKTYIEQNPKKVFATATAAAGWYFTPTYAKIFAKSISNGFAKGFWPNANLEKSWENVYETNKHICTDADALASYLQENIKTKNFLWGVSSSAYQIEGGFDSVVWTNPKTRNIEPACASDRFYKTILLQVNAFYW